MTVLFRHLPTTLARIFSRMAPAARASAGAAALPAPASVRRNVAAETR